MTSTPSLSTPPLSKNAWTGLDQAAFEACGMVLMGSVQAAIQQDKSLYTLLDPVRQWLDEATIRASGASLVWGHLCCVVLKEHTPILQDRYFLDDRDRLAGYLDAIKTVSPDAFMGKGQYVSLVEIHTTRRYWTRPVCDGLKTVLTNLVNGNTPGGSTPMLESLIERKHWDPVPLLAHLYNLLPEQRAYQASVVGHDGMEAETPHAKLLKLLCSATIATSWKPQDGELFGGMWDHVSALRAVPNQLTELYTDFLACMPSQAAKGIESIVHMQSMTSQQIDAFFPLPLNQCNPNALLGSLVVVMAMTRSDATDFAPAIARSRHFEERLAEYHPELAQLLFMHFTLFPESGADCTNAGVIAQAFEAVVNHTSNLPATTLNLPSLI